MKILTNVGVTLPVLGYLVVNILVVVEVERLESIKDEVAHVFVHVRPQDTTVKIVNSTASIHHLEN